MSGKNVLAARILPAFHHEMGISASAAPLPFNILGIGPSANDSVSISGSSRIQHHPHIVCDIACMAIACAFLTLFLFPRIEHFPAHETRAFISADDNRVLQHVENSYAKSLSGLVRDAEVPSGGGDGGRSHGQQERETGALAGVP